MHVQADAGEGLGRSQCGKRRQRREKLAEKREYRLYTEFIWSSFHTFLGERSFFHYWAEPFPYLEVFWAEGGGFDLIYRGTDGFKHCCRQV